MIEPVALLNDVRAIAAEAGRVILEIYQCGNYQKLTKQDDTPVTSADLAANSLLIERLTALTPDIPILSEEAADIDLQERRHWQRYWLLDPLDGTGEFIEGSGEFAVNIALIAQNEPVLGVVYAPVSGVCYFAAKGQGAFKSSDGDTVRIHARRLGELPQQVLRIAVSRRQQLSLIETRLDIDHPVEYIPFGSSTLKSCMVAEGVADLYFRVGPTGEWDTGAAQCIVEEAGGRIISEHLNPLSYNERESFENPNFITVGDFSLPWRDWLNL